MPTKDVVARRNELLAAYKTARPGVKVYASNVADLQWLVAQITISDHKPASALDEQIGGDHYKHLVIQPAEYCFANKMPAIESSIIRYATRWRDKGGFADLEKIIHYAKLLMELESKYTSTKPEGDE